MDETGRGTTIGDTHIVFDPKDQLGFAVVDALFSLARALAVVEVSSSMDDANRIAERIHNEDDSLVEASRFCNVELNDQIIAALAGISIQAWLDQDFAIARELVQALDFSVVQQNPSREQELIRTVCVTLGAVMDLASGDENSAKRVTGSLESLAKTLTVMDQYEEACACAVSASNVIPGQQRTDLLRSLPLAIELARTTEQYGVLVGLKLRYAEALARSGCEDAALQLDAFDAVESAVKILPADSQLRSASLSLVHNLVTMDFLRGLRIPLLLNLPEAGKKDAPPILRNAVGGSLVLDLQPEDLAALNETLSWAIEVENTRHALDPKPKTIAAEASWATWSFRHRAFERAVPRGSSILRERDMDELLLVLGHEIIHVFSMASGIGLALSALRAAVVDLELTLWTFVGASKSLSREELLVDGLAPLSDRNVLALAQAEQELELVRKTQILETLWLRWLEGIAVFGELADDPRDDPDESSPIVPVVMNLIDFDIGGESEREGRSKENLVMSKQEEAEVRYSKALYAIGRYRLRTYCDRFHTKYLPGYLAARSVVSAWRRSLDIPLTGTEAFRLLLHVTRFGTLDCIPHLGLPVATFAADARLRFANWLKELQAISADDLQLALSVSNSGRWVSGRYETVDPISDNEDVVEKTLLSRFREAKSSLSGELANVNRVPKADEPTREVMKAAGDAIALQTLEPSALASGFLERATVYPCVLPIGQVRCPFWLNRPTNSLICLIRTTETDYQHGGSSYDLMIVPLESGPFGELLDMVTSLRDARIGVTRVAFVAVDEKYQGRNYLAFNYGSWMHVMPAGLLFGVQDVPERLHEAIRWRLSRDDFDRAVELITANGGRAIANRTSRWTQSSSDWGMDGETYPIAQWVDRVHALADESRIPVHVEDDLSASRIALESVFYDKAVVDQVLENGLALDEKCEIGLSDIVAALDETARHPAQIDWLKEGAQDCLGFIFSRDHHGWDVAPPRT